MELVVDDVVVMRGERTIIDGLSLTVAAGELLLLTGSNGAGKTTLLRCIAGFLPAAAGAVRLEGGAADAELAEQCHWIGHESATKPALSATENLAFWARFLGGAPGRVPEALAALELDMLADVPAGAMSAGQRRRLALARLLVADRRLWLLDEPTSSLDAHSAAIVDRLLARHVGAGGLAIVATHRPIMVTGARELRLGA